MPTRLLLSLMLLLGGCGQKGPLFLPANPAPAPAPESAPSAEPASDPEAPTPAPGPAVQPE